MAYPHIPKYFPLLPLTPCTFDLRSPSLNTATLYATRRIFHVATQRTPSALQPLHKCLGHRIRPNRARMRMANRIIRIHNRLAKRLEDIRHILAVIDKRSRAANSCCRGWRIRSEAARRVRELAGLPRVVGRRGRYDDLGALGSEQFSSIGDVGWIGEDGYGFVVVGGGTSLGACAGAVCAAVVGGSERSTVIVAELNDHKVAGDEEVGYGFEAAFDSVTTGGAASHGLVHDGDWEWVFEVVSPA